MLKIRHPFSLLSLLIVWMAPPLFAQVEDGNENALAAYFALSNSPLAGTPSVFSRALLGGTTGMSFRAHAGFTDEEGEVSRRMLSLGVDMPAGRSSFGFSLGMSDFNCDLSEFDQFGGSFEGNCGSMYTGALTWTLPLVSSPVGTNGRFALGFDTGIGYSSGEKIIDFTIDFGGGAERLAVDGHGLSAIMGLPFAFVSRGGGIAFSPHLAPRLGFGRTTQTATMSDPSGTTTESATESGVIFMLGGGVSVLFERRGIAMDIGFQKSFVEDTNMTVGLGFSFAPRR